MVHRKQLAGSDVTFAAAATQMEQERVQKGMTADDYAMWVTKNGAWADAKKRQAAQEGLYKLALEYISLSPNKQAGKKRRVRVAK